MKLSKVTIGLLLLGASLAVAQEDKASAKKDKQQATKMREKNTKNAEGKEINHGNVTAEQDTLKPTRRKISKEYCPLCGMG